MIPVIIQFKRLYYVTNVSSQHKTLENPTFVRLVFWGFLTHLSSVTWTMAPSAGALNQIEIHRVNITETVYSRLTCIILTSHLSSRITAPMCVSQAQKSGSPFIPLTRERASDNSEWRWSTGDQRRVVVSSRSGVQRETGTDTGESASANRALLVELARLAAGRVCQRFTREHICSPSGDSRLDWVCTVRSDNTSR